MKSLEKNRVSRLERGDDLTSSCSVEDVAMAISHLKYSFSLMLRTISHLAMVVKLYLLCEDLHEGIRSLPARFRHRMAWWRTSPS